MPEAEQIEIVIQGNGLARVTRPLNESTMVSWEALMDPEWKQDEISEG